MCKTTKNNGLCAHFKFSYRSILSWLLVFFVNPVMALDLTLTANPDPAQNNEQVNVQMIVTNDGNTAETNLTAQMIYPVGLNNISESAVIGPLVTATSCNESGSTTLCQPGETLNWNIGTLQPGESSILRILPTTLNASVTGDVVSFSATVSDEANQLASSSADVDIDTEPELTLALFENKNPVASSDTLTYTLRYGNRSNANVTTTTLNFSIPSGTSFVSATGNGIESNGEVSWDLGTFVVGSVAQQQVVVMVDNALSDGTQLESSALIKGTSNFNPTERRSTSNTVIASSEPLDISLQLNPVMALGNQQVDLQIVVTNVSNANVTGTAVRMVHPNGANNVREASIIGPFDPSTSCDAAGSSTLCQPGEALNWNLGTLTPGQEVVMNLPVSALNNSVNGRVLPFAAVVTDDAQNTAIARNTLIVDTAPELTLSIFEDKNPVAAGDTLTYTLRYGNRSDANVTSSTLSFPIPVGTTFVSASNNGALTNSEVNWDLGTFPVGAVTQQQVVVQVDNPLVNGTQIRSAAVISGTSNANPTEQRATSNSVVASSAPLDISLQLNPVSALGNEQVDAQIVVTNTSNGNVTGAAVRMVFPQGANNVREASIMGPFDTATSCNAEGSTTLCQPGEALNWNLGTLIPGQTVLMGMPVSALNNSVNGRMVPFIAVVSDDAGDTAIARNTLIVDTDPELTLSMFEDKNPVAAGDTLTYTLSYGNRSDANVTSSALSFPVPVGTTFVSATGNGALVNGEVVWDLGTFLVGAVAQQQVSVLVNNALVNGTQIESSALIQGTSNFNPTERRVTSNSVVASSAPFDISVQLNPASAMGNEHVDLQVVVTNISNANISGTAVRMVYPQGADNVSELSITGPFDTATSCNAAGSTSLCQEGEALNWNLATLVPGQTVVMNLPFSALNNSVNGRVVPFAAVVTDDTGDTAVSRNALIVDTDPELTLSMFEDKHPVAAGDLLTYTLRYGNRSGANVTSTTLRLPIPVGTTFVAASPGSVVANGMVTWNLGDLSPEAIGEVRLRVRADNSLGAGTQLTAKAVIDGSVNSGMTERTANSLTVINDNAPLGFSLQVNAVPTLPGEAVEVQMSVTNNTVADITGITLQMLYPGGVTNTAEADITGLFDAATSCNASGSTALCQLHEVLNWNIGTLAAASSASASLPPEVAANWGEGNLINWIAVTRADGGATSWQMVTLPVGVGDDLDGDGFGGDFDNCPNTANPDQANYDLDALGDICDDDDDNDGLLDAFELQYGLNPFDASDATLDGDMDNLNNLDEQAAGTSPIDPDSDNDGLLDGEDNDPLNDNPPVANAGLDVMLREGNTVILDGSESSDSDGGNLTFAWLQTSGTPTVVLDDASSEMPSFTAPDVAGSEDFIFELTVTDSSNTAVTDSVTITVAEDAAPNADAGADQPSGSNTILPGDTVTLNGSNSSDDFDALSELTLAWMETSATGVVLSDASATMPTFVAPSFGSAGGVVTFELTVTDTIAQSDVDSVIINVSALSAPTADAGPAQDVVEGQTVTLNGANSSDTDGTIAGYLWSQTSGAMVTLSDTSVAQPTFTAPAAPETLTFELEVTDNDGLMASDTVMVNITTNPVPACMAGPDQMVAEFDNGNLSEVVLDAGSSTIASGTIDGYLWTQLSGSNVTLSTPNQVQSGFTVPEVAPGGEAFTFRVTCTSDLGVMASDELTINVSDVNRAPTADAGTDQNVNEQETVTLDGTASSDPDGTTITSYSWSLTSASLGSSVTLDDSTSAMPSFTAPDVDALSGEALTFELTVSDGDLQGSDTVIVNVVRVNEPPVADAGTAQNVDEGLAVTLTAAASTDPEGGVLDFVWTQKSGTQVTLADALTTTASFDAPSVGVGGEDLVFEVTITDDGGLMSMAEVTISVVNVPIDPVADAGGDQTVTEGDTVTLDGSGSTDADDNIVTYAWVQDSGDAVTLTGTSTAMASFEAPTVDSGTLTLVFTLTVTDELGNTSSEQVTITVKNTSSGGGGGGGCTLGEPGRIDPILPLLALFSLIWINRRKRFGAERMGT